MCESVFKVLVVGDSSVGKTAMVARYCHNKWLANYKVTLGGINMRLMHELSCYHMMYVCSTLFAISAGCNVYVFCFKYFLFIF